MLRQAFGLVGQRVTGPGDLNLFLATSSDTHWEGESKIKGMKNAPMHASEAPPCHTPAHTNQDGRQWQGSMQPAGMNRWSRRNHECHRWRVSNSRSSLPLVARSDSSPGLTILSPTGKMGYQRLRPYGTEGAPQPMAHPRNRKHQYNRWPVRQMDGLLHFVLRLSTWPSFLRPRIISPPGPP